MSDFLEADKSAGLRVLTGQDNYTRWTRDFQVIATGKGVWELYTGGLAIINKPDKAKFLGPAVMTRKKADEFDYAAAAAEYRIELDEREHYERERLARTPQPGPSKPLPQYDRPERYGGGCDGDSLPWLHPE